MGKNSNYKVDERPIRKDNELTAEEKIRYARHLCLPEIGEKGQRDIKSSSILCVGIGGLGSSLLLYLAAAGIGKIGLVDFDIVDKSNLQRQVIHGMSSLGMKKTTSAEKRIHDINPNCQVETYNNPLNKNNVLNIMKNYDIICDCSDNFPTKYLINDACILLNKVHIYAAIHQFEGQVSVFNLHPESPNYRDLLPEPPPSHLTPSCSDAGVLGILPGIIGTIQATEVIKIITGSGKPLDGRVLIFNALEMRFKDLKLLKDKDQPEVDSLIDYEEFCEGGMRPSEAKEITRQDSISARDLQEILKEDKLKYALIDVRSKEEYETKAIQGSKLIPLNKIKNEDSINYIQKLSSSHRIVLYCKSGFRSEKAKKILRNQGISSIDLRGGFDSWEREFN